MSDLLLHAGGMSGQHRSPASRVAVRRVAAAVIFGFATSGSVFGSSGLAAQSRYPASNPGAPPGVYSAPRLAIDSLTTMLSRDSLDFGANWRVARALTTLGALAGDAGRVATRDSLYQRATRHARRAVRIAPDRAEGHFMLAQLLGRVCASRPLRDRAGLSAQMLASAKKALAIDPAHDGAWSALGRWHLEVWRLNKLERFIATRFFGGTEMENASLQEGISALERAVSLRPNWIHHRFELARAYVDAERHDDAVEQLDAIAELPANDPEDPKYLRDAAHLSEWLAGRE
jgi:tetratricopeptide (TPR) repeat protein